MDAVYCRREAERCVKLSETATTPNLKTILLSMARSWIHLANQMDSLHEKTSKKQGRRVQIGPGQERLLRLDRAHLTLHALEPQLP